MAKVTTQVVSANDLLDGDVVYRDANGGWTRALEAALVVDNNIAANTLLEEASADHALIVGAYLFAVDVSDGTPAPAHIREQVRSSRVPSVRTDLA